MPILNFSDFLPNNSQEIIDYDVAIPYTRCYISKFRQLSWLLFLVSTVRSAVTKPIDIGDRIGDFEWCRVRYQNRTRYLLHNQYLQQ